MLKGNFLDLFNHFNILIHNLLVINYIKADTINYGDIENYIILHMANHHINLFGYLCLIWLMQYYSLREQYLNMVAQLGVLRFLSEEQKAISRLYKQDSLMNQKNINELIQKLNSQQNPQLRKELENIKQLIQRSSNAKHQLNQSKQPNYHQKIEDKSKEIENFLFKQPYFFRKNIQSENPEFDFHYYSVDQMKFLLREMTIQYNRLSLLNKHIRIITSDKESLFHSAGNWFKGDEFYGNQVEVYQINNKKCGYKVDFTLKGLSSLKLSEKSDITLTRRDRQRQIRKIHILKSIEIKLNSSMKKWSIKFHLKGGLDINVYEEVQTQIDKICKEKGLGWVRFDNGSSWIGSSTGFMVSL